MNSQLVPVGVAKPYFRTARQFADGSYTNAGKGGYVKHDRFAASPSNFVRAFELLQDDLKELFKFIEPSDANLETYSFRTLELLVRACIEVEANCKAILEANTYAGHRDNLNINDFKIIEFSHFLSQYTVKLPYWSGSESIRQPFAAWAPTTGKDGQKSLDWYRRYNKSKHDRANALSQATLGAVVDAVAGLLVLLTSQFLNVDFGPSTGSGFLLFETPDDGFEDAIGGYLRVAYPDNIPIAERYDFEWFTLSQSPEPFAKFDYTQL